MKRHGAVVGFMCRPLAELALVRLVKSTEIFYELPQHTRRLIIGQVAGKAYDRIKKVEEIIRAVSVASAVKHTTSCGRYFITTCCDMYIDLAHFFAEQISEIGDKCRDSSKRIVLRDALEFESAHVCMNRVINGHRNCSARRDW